MALRDHTRADSSGGYRGTPPEGEFWSAVAGLCRNHIDSTVEFFRSHDAPLLDWAEPRFRQLAEQDALDQLLATARAVLDGPASGKRPYVPVGAVGQWVVVASVHPSAADADFLAACPDGSFEALAHAARAAYRNDYPQVWANADQAHWLLLLDEPGYMASVHLHTTWSLRQRLAWMRPALERQTVTVPMAPFFVPVDLMRSDVYELSRQITLDDLSHAKSVADAPEDQP